MKKLLPVLLTLLCASAVFAWDNDDSIVRWKNVVGVITSVGVDNPVAGLHAGATPWSVRSGRASVNLDNGIASFEVEGLVINGGNSTGTPGPITAVNGTLVCNAGQNTRVRTRCPRGVPGFLLIKVGTRRPQDNYLFGSSGCQSSILLPSGSNIQANRPYS